MTLRAEKLSLVADLIRLGTIQSALAVAVAALMCGRAMIVPRLAGAAVISLGLAVLVQQLVPAP